MNPCKTLAWGVYYHQTGCKLNFPEKQDHERGYHILICSNTFIKTNRATKVAKENIYRQHFQWNWFFKKCPKFQKYKLVKPNYLTSSATTKGGEHVLVVGRWLFCVLFCFLISRALNPKIAKKYPKRRGATVRRLLSKGIKERTEKQREI